MAYRGKRFRVGDFSGTIVRNQGNSEWNDIARSGGPISARRLRTECQNRARAAVPARLLAAQRQPATPRNIDPRFTSGLPERPYRRNGQVIIIFSLIVGYE